MSMHSFVKLYSGLLESTIWEEDSDTRIVWITLLCLADMKGRVGASIPGVASRARVSVKIVEQAIEKFKKPDAYSRTKLSEGRRIEDIEGGWKILNFEQFKNRRDELGIRESKLRYWAKNKDKLNLQRSKGKTFKK